jgi:ribonuclease D
MEPFAGLAMDRISVVVTAPQAEHAMALLCAAGVVGFDTESKPTFRKGEKSAGPHVLQFATMEQAFIFRASHTATHPVIMRLLAAPELTKIGFGLDGDLRQISARFGIRPAAIVDLGRSFRKLGYRNPVGARSAVAILFGRRLLKSKSVTTSNWAAGALSENQLCYAANDAYAAIRCHHALQALLPAKE